MDNNNENMDTHEKLNFEGNWNEIKGKLKQEYADLTDDDLQYEKGREDELIGKIQQKVGKTQEEVMGKLKSLQNDFLNKIS